MEILLLTQWILCFITTIYVVLITIYYISWMRLPFFIYKASDVYSTKVSVIIPARNEEENIANCIQDLMKQTFPKQLMEILIIDDASTDNTVAIAKEIIHQHPEFNIKIISLNNLPSMNANKKNAIAIGIRNATGSLMVNTDADCRYSMKWIETMVGYYEKNNAKFISAPVCFMSDYSFFEKMQTLEFMSLIGIGAAAINTGIPMMCNGANIAFERAAYMEVNGDINSEGIASGDDIFLMLKIADKYPQGIHFIKSLDATVYTYAKKTINEFYMQRKRWASKGMKYTNIPITAVAMITYFANLAWLLNLILCIFYPTMIPVFIILTLACMCVEIPFLYALAAFFNRRKLIMIYLPTFIFNIFYVIIIGAMGSIGKYAWKGRIVK